MLAALSFSLGTELYYLSIEGPDSGHIYYRYGEFLWMLRWGEAAVPVWVGVGWSCILYASMWTTDRLELPLWSGPITAGLLAVNIDLSLDPIAEALGFWTWHETPPANYLGVPFDNFVGWLMIVGFYALCWRLLFQLADEREWPARDWWVPWLAIPGALGLIAGSQYLLVGFVYPAMGQAWLFFLLFAVCNAVAFFGGRHCVRDNEPNRVVIALPLAFHGVMIALLLPLVESHAPLIVIVPTNLVLGMLAFAWPSLDTKPFHSS